MLGSLSFSFYEINYILNEKKRKRGFCTGRSCYAADVFCITKRWYECLWQALDAESQVFGSSNICEQTDRNQHRAL